MRLSLRATLFAAGDANRASLNSASVVHPGSWNSGNDESSPPNSCRILRCESQCGMRSRRKGMESSCVTVGRCSGRRCSIDCSNSVMRAE